MPVTLTSKGPSLDESVKRLREFADNGTRAGLFSQLATRGLRVEAGFKHPTAGRVQARPWLSVAADAVAPKLLADLERDVGKVADGAKTADAALLAAAELVKDSAERVIIGNLSGGPALAKSTQERKGHGTRGLDSGEMLDALDVELGRPEQ